MQASYLCMAGHETEGYTVRMDTGACVKAHQPNGSLMHQETGMPARLKWGTGYGGVLHGVQLEPVHDVHVLAPGHSRERHKRMRAIVACLEQVFMGLLDGVQTVAVKRLTDQCPRQQERFAHEVQLLRSCRSENIVSFLGARHELTHAATLCCHMPHALPQLWCACNLTLCAMRRFRLRRSGLERDEPL